MRSKIARAQQTAWRRPLIWLVALGCGLCDVAAEVAAQTLTDRDRAALMSTWRGYWTDRGYLYEARLSLRCADDNSIDGEIHWTLRRSPRQQEQARLGLRSFEYIKGRYDPSTRKLEFEGHDLGSQAGILGHDKYRLTLSPNALVIEGITWSHGPWTGRLKLIR